MGGYYGENGGSADAFFQGKISEVRVYSRELSSSQIQFNFNASKGRFGIS